MSDLTTVWDNTVSLGDWSMAGADLLSGDDLVTATLISLFTDRSATPTDKLPDGTTDRRGWWGDIAQTPPIGSRLWLLARAKLMPATAAIAKGYVRDALQWLIDDGVASSIDVAASILLPRTLAVTLTITRTDGTARVIRYQWAWDQLAA
jgi:phage gp46-like protein